MEFIDLAFRSDGRFVITDRRGSPGQQCVEWLSFIESWMIVNDAMEARRVEKEAKEKAETLERQAFPRSRSTSSRGRSSKQEKARP